MLHSRVLGEQTQLKEEMETLRRDNAQLVREHNHLKQNCEELNRLHSQDQAELADLRQQQQQVHAHTRAVSAVAVRYYTIRDIRFTEMTQNLEPVDKIKHDYSQKLHILIVQRDFCLIIDFVTLHNLVCCLLCTKDLVHKGAGAHIGLLCSTVAHSTRGNTAVLKSTGQSSKWKCIQSISEKGKCRRERPRRGQRAR